MKEIKIVNNQNMSDKDFENLLNKLVLKGWRLRGDLFSHDQCLYQSLTRKKKK